MKRLLNLSLLCLLFGVWGCGKTDIAPSNNNNNSNNNGYNNPPTQTVPNTFFISNSDYLFNGQGDWWMNGFTVSQTTTFDFRLASRYGVQASIITLDQEYNFKNGLAFSGYSSFNGTFGTHTITLAPGSYDLAIRNETNGANIFSTELDYAISLPASDKCTFYDQYVSGSYDLSAAQRLWQPFTIQAGYRYFMDGCNTDLNVYIIPDAELANFKNGQTFQYYTDYTTGTGGDPGLSEITLPPGNYDLVAFNPEQSPNAITFTMERWRQN